MIIKEIMSERVVTISMDDRLVDVKDIFDNVRFHHLVALDDQAKVVGILSESDVLAALSPYIGKEAESSRDTATLLKRVHHVMIREPRCCLETTSILEAGKWFVKQDLGCLPVVDQQQQLIGIVTWRDVLGFALEQISEGDLNA